MHVKYAFDYKTLVRQKSNTLTVFFGLCMLLYKWPVESHNQAYTLLPSSSRCTHHSLTFLPLFYILIYVLHYNNYPSMYIRNQVHVWIICRRRAITITNSFSTFQFLCVFSICFVFLHFFAMALLAQ